MVIEEENARYELFKWNKWHVFNWLLNPGLVVNDLFLGQRLPMQLYKKVQPESDVLVDDASAFLTDMYFLCPHCNKMHSANTWSNSRAFGNWLGLYCSHCTGIIPCVPNVFSILTVAITSPLWFWKRKTIKSQWLAFQQGRMGCNAQHETANRFMSWLVVGFSFSGFMYVMSYFVSPFFIAQDVNNTALLVGLLGWLLGGLSAGFIVKSIVELREERLYIQNVKNNTAKAMPLKTKCNG